MAILKWRRHLYPSLGVGSRWGYCSRGSLVMIWNCLWGLICLSTRKDKEKPSLYKRTERAVSNTCRGSLHHLALDCNYRRSFFCRCCIWILFSRKDIRARPGRRVTVILPLLPGAIGSLLYVGVVQPHEEMTRVITRGASPVFLISSCMGNLTIRFFNRAEVVFAFWYFDIGFLILRIQRYREDRHYGE